MDTLGPLEPLAIHFENKFIAQDGPQYPLKLSKRSSVIAERNSTIAIQQQHPSRLKLNTVVAEGGADILPIARLQAAHCLRIKDLRPPTSLYYSFAGFSQSIGNVLLPPARTGSIEMVTTTATTTPTTRRGSISELPPDVRVSYLAEGGANVVYRIILPANASPQLRSKFRGKLLRLRKFIESTTPYVETVRNFDNHVRPLFDSDELVDQELIRIPRQVIAACNAQLERDERSQTRPKSRHGVYLSTKEPFGLLITDMTPEPGSGDCLWEFKPKWLFQSPSAPADATRCRTCALRAMKNHDARLVGAKESRSFCPLDLISGNFEDTVRATSFMKGAHGRNRVAKFLHRNKTLARLQTLQQQLNAVGLPGLEAPYRERALSMTIRDCTMYVKVPADEQKPLEVRLGDLDFKSGAGGKLQYWRDLESRLINEGWYTGPPCRQQRGECSLLRPRPAHRTRSSGSSIQTIR